MFRFLALALALIVFPMSDALAQNRAGSAVQYFDGDTELEGYWVPSSCEAAAASLPLVLVIHQWKGITDHERDIADKIAAECKSVMAIDMYGKGVRPQTNEEAGIEATKYKSDAALARGRLQAALDFATQKTGTSQIAAIGYCFGGTMALEMARMGANINGAVSFHGGLSTPEPVTEQGVITASILVHHGDIDPLVPDEEVNAFLDEMRQAGVDLAFTRYAGAVHSFTHKDAGNDISSGVAYDEKADKRSWAATMYFFSEIFKP
jgi:dienelactone hydrolase